MIIYATGFKVVESVTSLNVAGRDGRKLAPETLEAYRGVTVTGFPNLFLLLGPNTGLGHTSVVFMIESQIQHVLSCLRILARDKADVIEVSEAAQRRYNDALQRRLRRAVWSEGGCDSWYLGRGRGEPDAVARLHLRVLGAHPPGAPRRLRRSPAHERRAGGTEPGAGSGDGRDQPGRDRAGDAERRPRLPRPAPAAARLRGRGAARRDRGRAGGSVVRDHRHRFPGYRTGRACRPRAGHCGLAGTRAGLRVPARTTSWRCWR